MEWLKKITHAKHCPLHLSSSLLILSHDKLIITSLFLFIIIAMVWQIKSLHFFNGLCFYCHMTSQGKVEITLNLGLYITAWFHWRLWMAPRTFGPIRKRGAWLLFSSSDMYTLKAIPAIYKWTSIWKEQEEERGKIARREGKKNWDDKLSLETFLGTKMKCDRDRKLSSLLFHFNNHLSREGDVCQVLLLLSLHPMPSSWILSKEWCLISLFL